MRRESEAAVLASALALSGLARAAPEARTGIDWQPIGASFQIARTETTVGQFRRFVQATGAVTQAERQGGGEVFEAGWVRKAGWHWRTPFGKGSDAHEEEPAVHVTYDEAQAFCTWAGARLPTDLEWTSAAYTELRTSPPTPFKYGQTYPYPTGSSPDGAQCLGDCGPLARSRALSHGANLMRGYGHARVDATPKGVNGLHDMGGNAWEWVDDPPGRSGSHERRTRGGSWWYGSPQMRSNYLQSKPGNVAVVYIGFRCAKDFR